MHGAGSPQAQRIMIGRKINMQEKIRAAMALCDIENEKQKQSGELWAIRSKPTINSFLVTLNRSFSEFVVIFIGTGPSNIDTVISNHRKSMGEF